MGIKGDVRSISLANVLQDLAMNEQTGTLHIRHKERQISLWFERGALRLVGLGPGEGPSILNGLLARGKVAFDAIPTGKRPREAGFIRDLLKKGKITREDLKAALEHEMSERLCDVLLWTDATFEFEEGEPDDALFDADQLDLEPRLAIDAVVMEAARRSDEWTETRKAVLSPDEILVTDPTRVSAEIEATTRRVLDLLDGARSIREVQDMTRLGQFTVQRAAAILIKCGAARPLTAAEALERAKSLAGRKEYEAALRMVRYGLDHERSNIGLLEQALRCAAELEDSAAAASYGRQLATAQVESGALEGALETYQKVLTHAPRDLVSHERLFALMLQLDLKLDALATGEALASAYKKAGLADKALDVYRKLTEKVGDHTDLLESVAEIQRHLGDKHEAVDLYRKLLARALEAKDDDAALDYCRTIIKIDPRHEEAIRFRQQLESGALERWRRRRRAVKAFVAAAVVLGLVGGAAVYEGKARGMYEQVRTRLLDAREAKHYHEALSLYDLVLTSFPLSLKTRELRPEREQLEERYVREECARAQTIELAEGVRNLQAALEVTRSGERVGKVTAILVTLRKRLRDAEEDWRLRLASLTPPDIALVRDPLAVAALKELLANEKALVRRASVTALGAIDGSESLQALMQALADLDPAVCQDASAHLVRRTGQNFGTDRLKWEEWWLRRGRLGGTPPLQAALLSSRQSYAPKETIRVEWRITNFGNADAEFTLTEPPSRRLQVAGTSAGLAPEGSGRRTVRLGPGEFVGGTFDLTALVDVPGGYRLLWSAALLWNAKPVTLEASPLILERSR